MFRAWVCETCRRPQKFRDNIWDCPGCGKEGCDDCFDRYAHCKACGAGKTDEELRIAANAKGFDFDPPFKQHLTSCAAYSNYQPPYYACTCGAEK